MFILQKVTSYSNPNNSSSATAVAAKTMLSPSGTMSNNGAPDDSMDKNDNDDLSSKIPVSVISPEVMEYMVVIKELLNTTEAQQMAFIKKLEVLQCVVLIFKFTVVEQTIFHNFSKEHAVLRWASLKVNSK